MKNEKCPYRYLGRGETGKNTSSTARVSVQKAIDERRDLKELSPTRA
jgi:hypothetical protein